jgi:pyridinium-3,5-bisthiocarboxylic acid mononucleotide nickel chelatase
VIEAYLAAGAVDVWSTPAGMKHGRPGITHSAVVSPTHERAVAETMLRHTTALGLRVRRIEHRWALERKFHEVDVYGHRENVKFGLLDGEVVNIKPEHRDCVRVAHETGQSVKTIWTEHSPRMPPRSNRSQHGSGPTRTIRLPTLSPFSSPMSAAGALWSPSMMS